MSPINIYSWVTERVRLRDSLHSLVPILGVSIFLIGGPAVAQLRPALAGGSAAADSAATAYSNAAARESHLPA
jgi:hypothetical protein